MYREKPGNLINFAYGGHFDVIAHGISCWCRQKSGLAPQMAENFLTHAPEWYSLEHKSREGDINKLGQIQYQDFFIFKNEHNRLVAYNHNISIIENYKNPVVYGLPGTSIVKAKLSVVNCYTQYKIAKFNGTDYPYTTTDVPVDYEAMALCFRKLNSVFKGKHIGLPQIGAGKAGGEWSYISALIKEELKDCDVTVVIYSGH